MPKIAVTAASGKLGRLIAQELLDAGEKPLLVVRNPARVPQTFLEQGAEVAQADYLEKEGLVKAFQGVERVVLISSPDMENDFPQHRNVIEAAVEAGVGFLTYTGVLHADVSELNMVPEHRLTEACLKNSGLRFTVLRNGWYTENFTDSVAEILAAGRVETCAGEGRISSAARADFAAAAARVVLSPERYEGQFLELAGDLSFTMREFAEAVARASGKEIEFRALSEAEHTRALLQAGVSEYMAPILASWDAEAAKGALLEESRTLSRVIGRATTPMEDTVKAAVAQALEQQKDGDKAEEEAAQKEE